MKWNVHTSSGNVAVTVLANLSVILHLDRGAGMLASPLNFKLLPSSRANDGVWGQFWHTRTPG